MHCGIKYSVYQERPPTATEFLVQVWMNHTSIWKAFSSSFPFQRIGSYFFWMEAAGKLCTRDYHEQRERGKERVPHHLIQGLGAEILQSFSLFRPFRSVCYKLCFGFNAVASRKEEKNAKASSVFCTWEVWQKDVTKCAVKISFHQHVHLSPTIPFIRLRSRF